MQHQNKKKKSSPKKHYDHGTRATANYGIKQKSSTKKKTALLGK
jgi:hypothetical protein